MSSEAMTSRGAKQDLPPLKTATLARIGRMCRKTSSVDSHQRLSVVSDVFQDSYRWLAPEVLISGQYGPENDVFMFGTTMWEAFWTRDVALRDPAATEKSYAPCTDILKGQVLDFVRENTPLHKPEMMPDWNYELALQCRQPDLAKRPNMLKVYDTLKQHITSDWGSEPFFEKTNTEVTFEVPYANDVSPAVPSRDKETRKQASKKRRLTKKDINRVFEREDTDPKTFAEVVSPGQGSRRMDGKLDVAAATVVTGQMQRKDVASPTGQKESAVHFSGPQVKQLPLHSARTAAATAINKPPKRMSKDEQSKTRSSLSPMEPHAHSLHRRGNGPGTETEHEAEYENSQTETQRTCVSVVDVVCASSVDADYRECASAHPTNCGIHVCTDKGDYSRLTDPALANSRPADNKTQSDPSSSSLYDGTSRCQHRPSVSHHAPSDPTDTATNQSVGTGNAAGTECSATERSLNQSRQLQSPANVVCTSGGHSLDVSTAVDDHVLYDDASSRESNVYDRIGDFNTLMIPHENETSHTYTALSDCPPYQSGDSVQAETASTELFV